MRSARKRSVITPFAVAFVLAASVAGARRRPLASVEPRLLGPSGYTSSIAARSTSQT